MATPNRFLNGFPTIKSESRHRVGTHVINVGPHPVREKITSKLEKFIIINMGTTIVKEEYWYKIDTFIRNIYNP